mgnify:CR=1 FL=1
MASGTGLEGSLEEPGSDGRHFSVQKVERWIAIETEEHDHRGSPKDDHHWPGQEFGRYTEVEIIGFPVQFDMSAQPPYYDSVETTNWLGYFDSLVTDDDLEALAIQEIASAQALRAHNETQLAQKQ